ncbi:MAG: hypothetical protein HY537_12395 [Deltaproteobacteria bacterium]|nr:hypothetical protein [Deltaproteobacteria bacterium]
MLKSLNRNRISGNNIKIFQLLIISVMCTRSLMAMVPEAAQVVAEGANPDCRVHELYSEVPLLADPTLFPSIVSRQKEPKSGRYNWRPNNLITTFTGVVSFAILDGSERDPAATYHLVQICRSERGNLSSDAYAGTWGMIEKSALRAAETAPDRGLGGGMPPSTPGHRIPEFNSEKKSHE